MPNLPPVGLAKFSMTEDEIARALALPLDDPMRFDVKMLPDTEDNPKPIRRVIASGYFLWKSRGDRPLARLIQHLLYLYFTGQIEINPDGSSSTRMVIQDDEVYDDEDFEDDFEFTER